MRALEGRGAIITGASQGLGFAISQRFVLSGANVLLCARDEEKLDHAKSRLLLIASPNQKILTIAADVSSEDCVDAIVGNAVKNFSDLHILVNNAGIYGPMGLIEEINWKDWVNAIEINLLGSVLMCKAVLPYFKRNKYGKIIQLSGGGATAPLPRISAYAASKAAIVRFAETLAEEVREDRIFVNSVAPGALNTRMLDEALSAGPQKVGEKFYTKALRQREDGGASLEQAASLVEFLASSASDGISGKLISSVWDPWETLHEHVADLRGTDVYTLRRITPVDRNFNWGAREK